MGKGENAGYHHFLLFPDVFKGLLPQGRYMYKYGLYSKGLYKSAEKAIT